MMGGRKKKRGADFRNQSLSRVASVAGLLRSAFPIKPFLVLRPVNKLSQSNCIISFLHFERLASRQLDHVRRFVVECLFADGDDRAARWQQYAHVLLAANEMLFLD